MIPKLDTTPSEREYSDVIDELDQAGRTYKELKRLVNVKRLTYELSENRREQANWYYKKLEGYKLEEGEEETKKLQAEETELVRLLEEQKNG